MSGSIGSFVIGQSAIGQTPSAVQIQSGAATIVPTLSANQFARRLATNIPKDWAGADAAQEGLVYSVLESLGTQLSYVMEQLSYAADAQRLTTETYPELDFASQDFLGFSLPRPNGTSDSAHSQMIIEDLFKKAVTRTALKNAITTATGQVPRMMEPWSIFDTGTWTMTSYWDVDTSANPARWGDSSLRYQGFIETVPPSIAAIGPNNPILCWNDGAYWNQPGYFFGTISSAGAQDLYSLINSLRAWGTIVWVKFVTATSQTTIVAPSAPTSVTAGSTSPITTVVSWKIPATGTPPFSYQVFYALHGATNYQTGPSSLTNSAVVSVLQPGTQYDFVVWASNLSGTSAMSAVASATTLQVTPGPATNLSATSVGPTSVVIAFSAPTGGTSLFLFQVLYRVTGTATFTAFGTAGSQTSVTVTGLQPTTNYDFEVRTSNVGS